jgi:hypothetical protein
VTPVVALGGVLLQHCLPILAADVAIPRGLRQGSSLYSHLHSMDARLPAVHQQLLDRDEFLMEI